MRSTLLLYSNQTFFFSQNPGIQYKFYLFFFCSLGPIKMCNKATAQSFTQNRNVRKCAEILIDKQVNGKSLFGEKIWVRLKRPG